MAEKQTLYDISQELKDVMNGLEIDLETGEIIDGELDKLDELYDNFDAKVQDCVNYVRRTAAESELAKEEAKKINAYSKTLENKAKWMAIYIKDIMLLVGLKRVIVSGRPATVAKNPMSVEVDLSKVHLDWTNVKAEVKADKKAIIKHIKAGNEVPAGVTVIDNKTSLRY